MTHSRWERFVAAMQKPFPDLTHLQVWVYDDVVPAHPDSFLGGSAPRLRTLSLLGIAIPSLPKLLLSAKGLVTLTLLVIPDSGYIPPDAMVTALTVMTRLESLNLRFRSPQSPSRPDPPSQPLPPPTRLLLPALTRLTFIGVHEYLEDLLARVDAPNLNYLLTIFSMDHNFDVPQLHRLIGRAEEFKTFDRTEMFISNDSIRLILSPKTATVGHPRLLHLGISCRKLDQQLSSLTQVYSSFPLISTLEELEIWGSDSSHSNNDMESAQWLELLHPFAALKNLYLSHGIAQRVCNALRALSVKRENEVLPALRNVFVWNSGSLPVGPIQGAMEPFVAARRLSSHPMMVVDGWVGEPSPFCFKLGSNLIYFLLANLALVSFDSGTFANTIKNVKNVSS